MESISRWPCDTVPSFVESKDRHQRGNERGQKSGAGQEDFLHSGPAVVGRHQAAPRLAPRCPRPTPANASFSRQKRNPGVTEIVEMPNRGHALTIDSGWRE